MRLSRNRQGIVFLGLLLTLGCAADAAPRTSPAPPAVLGERFEPAACGGIEGQVIWSQAAPVMKPFTIYASPLAGALLKRPQERPRPNYPKIDPITNGLANAVVSLRGIHLDQSKPWPWPEPRLEMSGGDYSIHQGSYKGSIAFCRRGGNVEMVSKDPYYHACRAGGAAFFTLPFQDPDMPLTRHLPNEGVVELSSGCGYYWIRAYLIVSEHPYVALTDKHGQFNLEQIPEGDYELVAWHPSWEEERVDRDPETAFVSRVHLKPSLERAIKIRVAAGGSSFAKISLP